MQGREELFERERHKRTGSGLALLCHSLCGIGESELNSMSRCEVVEVRNLAASARRACPSIKQSTRSQSRRITVRFENERLPSSLRENSAQRNTAGPICERYLLTGDEGRTTFCLFLLQFVTDAVGLTIHGAQEVVGRISRWLCHYHGIQYRFESFHWK